MTALHFSRWCLHVLHFSRWCLCLHNYQIGLHILACWSESLLSAGWRFGSLAMNRVPCKDFDYIVWMHRLIWVLAGITCNLVGNAVKIRIHRFGFVNLFFPVNKTCLLTMSNRCVTCTLFASMILICLIRPLFGTVEQSKIRQGRVHFRKESYTPQLLYNTIVGIQNINRVSYTTVLYPNKNV